MFATSAILAAAVSPAKAQLLYESAELGPIGQASGALVGDNSYIGVRFEVFGDTTADRMGGHLGTATLPSATLFGALVQLSGPGDFPNTHDLSSVDVLRTTVLTVPYGSNEVIEKFTPISLSAGWYALVFGSAKFGATGTGMAALNNTDYGSPSYISRYGAYNWINPATAGARFVVAGPSAKEWATPASGNWNSPSSWYTAGVPQSYEDVSFEVNGTYTVNFTQNASVHDVWGYLGNVTLALGTKHLTTTGQVIVGRYSGGSSALTVQNGILSMPAHDIIVGDAGVGSMTVSDFGHVSGYGATTITVGRNAPGTLEIKHNGQVYSAHGRVAGWGVNGTGLVTLSNAGIWNVRDSFDVGIGAAGVVNINPGGELHVGNMLSIQDMPGSEVRLQGGWLRVGTLSTNLSQFIWTSGTLQTTNTLWINHYSPLGTAPVIGPGRTLRCDGGLQVDHSMQFQNAGATVIGPINNDGTFTQTGGSTQVTGSNGFTTAGNGVMNVTGGTFAARRIKQQALTIGGDGVVKLDVPGATGPSTSRTGPINITGSGKLDITDKKLITFGGSAALGSWNGSAYTGITGLIQSGRGDGSWNGSGIVTSMTDATSGVLTTVAVCTGADIGADGQSIMWGGEFVGSNSVLIMYTWGGDADLNGELNGDDYFFIDSNILTQNPGYHNGDFDYNGEINGDDYFIIDANITFAQNSPPFPTGAGAGGLATVPEPRIGGGVAVAMGLLRRRRRRAFSSPRTGRIYSPRRAP
jgi:hypothetical protein